MKLSNNISKNKSGFKLPKAYFEELDQRILKSIDSSQHIKQSPLLPLQSGFTIPEAYFDAFEKTIHQKTLLLHQPKVFNLWYHQIAKVAAVLLIMITGYGILKVTKPLETKENEFSNLSDTDIENYIESYIFPYSEMRNIYISEDNFELADNQIENLHQDVILNYLDDELDELDLLNE